VLQDQVASLDRSFLVIQGPPGSGKTWMGARLIVGLMRRGLRVGITSTAHKAIHNLLDAVEKVACAEDLDFHGLKKCSSQDSESRYENQHIRSESSPEAFPPSDDVRLIGGTAWLFARNDMGHAVDVLFVDEAGQVSLADALAVAQSAGSVVLLGDPQQLAHVSQGTHPRNSGASVLQHILGDEATVRPTDGVFLDITWRMHPDVCRFVSETMYDGRLESAEGCSRRSVTSSGLSGTGVRHLGVPHEGNTLQSSEEAERVAAEIGRLVGAGFVTESDGEQRPLTLSDILVVAPYNAQVRLLRERLPAGARVGTVDKFQGQQAPVVFFSMASSSGEDVPRGMDFLFNRNRLNVAVSRAQCLAVVVSSSRLPSARCNSVEQMRLVNSLCLFIDMAADKSAVVRSESGA
jgi:uncharacterized protein